MLLEVDWVRLRGGEEGKEGGGEERGRKEGGWGDEGRERKGKERGKEREKR